MYIVEVVIRDSRGNIISQELAKEYHLDVGDENYACIESEVEKLRHKLLPDIEKVLLERAQEEFSESIKKGESLNAMAPLPSR